MDIDLNQLPIPDWGVECPRCRYPLVGLPSHRCPECSLEFDMGEVVQTWHRLRPPRFTGHEDPFPDYGLFCRRCSEPLAGARGGVCAHCGRKFDPDDFLPKKSWRLINPSLYGGVSAAALAPILAAERIPHIYAANETVREVFGISNLVDARVMIPKEFYFDALWLIKEKADALRQVREQAPTNWRCATCGHDVPGHFEICWNCEAVRAEREAEPPSEA